MDTREVKNQEIHEEVEKEELRLKQRGITKIILKIILFIFLFSTIFYLYTDNISNKLLLINESRVTNSKIPNSFNGKKIVQFSDLHYGSNIFYKDLKKVVDKINYINPDIVVFTGDLIDKNYKIKKEDKENISKLLSNIKYKLGKYAIYGDNDINNISNSLLTEGGFKILNNSFEYIYSSNDAIVISGLNTEQMDITSSYNYTDDLYNISLIHKSDMADDIKDKTNLILAGNSMNGMIKTPKGTGLYKVKGSYKYINKYYELGNSSMYVNGGIGVIGPGFRLFNHPYISLYRLSNNKA